MMIQSWIRGGFPDKVYRYVTENEKGYIFLKVGYGISNQMV